MYSTRPIQWNIKSTPASLSRSIVRPALYVFSLLGGLYCGAYCTHCTHHTTHCTHQSKVYTVQCIEYASRCIMYTQQNILYSTQNSPYCTVYTQQYSYTQRSLRTGPLKKYISTSRVICKVRLVLSL